MVAQPKYILSINCGSSSVKFGLYRAETCMPELSGQISGIGQQYAVMEIRHHDSEVCEYITGIYPDLNFAISTLIDWFRTKGKKYRLLGIAHRLVHGGPHRQPELITPELLTDLRKYIYLAPNHLPAELETIQTFTLAYPQVIQLACFDTAFHRHIPANAKNYPLPAAYRKKGLLKYGFHGLSYQYIMEELATIDPVAARRKVIIAHLGNGASMAAVYRGKGVDTTMGISPIGGMVMGTRSGDLDPGVLLFLMNRCGMGPADLEDLLSKRSGLKALAGISDMQELLKRESHKKDAGAAVTMFCYSAKKHIGSLAAALEGLDVLIFTGGIGENSPIIRERICRGLGFMGIELDIKKNIKAESIISTTISRVTVRVIKTNEELMMARLVLKYLTAIKTKSL